MLILGSEGLVTAGSTRPGALLGGFAGLRRKVRVLSTENQMRLPARCGTVTVTVFPGAPSGIAQSWARGAPVDEGLEG